MVCLLVREDYRRWERWFNQKRQMAMPDHYQARDYISPYAKSDKALCPDPPHKSRLQREEREARRAEQGERGPPLTPEQRKERRRNREAARQRLNRLNDAWEAAQAALMERAGIDDGDAEGEK